MNTEQGTILVVDGDDRIIEVATQEWVEQTGELGPGVISAWDCAETIEIPITTLSDSTKGWRIIFELPNGCFETDMAPMEPGTTLTIEPTVGMGALRACEQHPQNEVAYLAASMTVVEDDDA